MSQATNQGVTRPVAGGGGGVTNCGSDFCSRPQTKHSDSWWCQCSSAAHSSLHPRPSPGHHRLEMTGGVWVLIGSMTRGIGQEEEGDSGQLSWTHDDGVRCPETDRTVRVSCPVLPTYLHTSSVRPDSGHSSSSVLETAGGAAVLCCAVLCCAVLCCAVLG